MKSVSLVQVQFQTGPKSLNSYYLPYSVGCLWSYATTSEYVKNNYRVEHIVWRRDPIDQLAPKLAKTDIVFISCYVWNRNYSYTLASAIKKIDPTTLIVVGGPEPAIESPLLFQDCPFIDIAVKLEGEKTVRGLLENLDNMHTVTGMLINDNGKVIDTGPHERLTDLEELPSPYLTGFFDQLIEQYPEISWSATLETNRGCPYQCTFCDWGSLTYQKVKKFDLQKVYDEIDWIVQNCGFVAITDANFGIYVERDAAIIDYFLEAQERYNNTVMWGVNWAKNIKKDVIEIAKKLVHNPRSQGQGLTLSVQSMDENVLDIIKRKNMHAENISEIYKLAEQNGIAVYTDFIFGLPGETSDSWSENFYKMMRLDIHSFVEVHHSQLLENAEMNLIQRGDYKLESAPIYDFLSGMTETDDWEESCEIVVSTNTMSREQMIESYAYTWFLTTFHMFGITNWISRFLFKYINIDYKDFYEGLYSVICDDAWFIEQKRLVKEIYKQRTSLGKVENYYVGNVAIQGWNLLYLSALEIQNTQKHKYVLNLVNQYLQTFDLDESILSELIEFQSAYLIDLNDTEQYPLHKNFSYNFYEYIVHDKTFVNTNNRIVFDFEWPKDESFDTKLERVFFQRRTNYSKASIKQIN